MAARASASFSISTKPKPRERPGPRALLAPADPGRRSGLDRGERFGAGNVPRVRPRNLGRGGNGDKARPATGLGGHLLDLSGGIARGKAGRPSKNAEGAS